MGKFDSETIEYVKRPEVFADLFNALIYGGDTVIKPENLRELDARAIVLPFGKDGVILPENKSRDVLKQMVLMEDDKVAYAVVLGVENQLKIHYAMPVRNMLYDAINYSSQVKEIAKAHRKNEDEMTNEEFLSGLKAEDRLQPVITLVLYFGQDKWERPYSVHDMLNTDDERILKYVPDYRMNLISPVAMTDEDLEKYKSDFKELAAFIRCAHDKDAMQKLINSDEKYKHMDRLTASIANECTNSKLDLVVNEEGEIDMCVAIAGIRQDGVIEGEEKKAKDMAINLYKQGVKPDVIATAAGVAVAVVEKWLGLVPA